jgi:putative flippase GtrA
MLRGQFSRYVVAGSLAVGLHFVVLILLVELFSIDATAATSVGFICACIANYLMQQAWVFGTAGAHRIFLPRYAVVTAGTFVLNVVLFWFAHDVIGLWYPAAQFLAYGLVFLANFVINRHYTFRELPRGS